MLPLIWWGRSCRRIGVEQSGGMDSLLINANTHRLRNFTNPRQGFCFVVASWIQRAYNEAPCLKGLVWGPEVKRMHNLAKHINLINI